MFSVPNLLNQSVHYALEFEIIDYCGGNILMKRFVTFVTVFALVLSLTACKKASTDTETETTVETTIEETEDTTVEETVEETTIPTETPTPTPTPVPFVYDEENSYRRCYELVSERSSSLVTNYDEDVANEVAQMLVDDGYEENFGSATAMVTWVILDIRDGINTYPGSSVPPTTAPTQPTTAPTSAPTTAPTQPATQPTSAPTQPTTAPTQPTAAPTAAPTATPTPRPTATPTPVPSTSTATCPQCGDTYQVPSDFYQGNEYVYMQYHPQCSRERVWATIENSETGEELCTIYGWRYFDGRGLIWDNGVDPDTLCERYWDNEGIITGYYGN